MAISLVKIRIAEHWTRVTLKKEFQKQHGYQRFKSTIMIDSC